MCVLGFESQVNSCVGNHVVVHEAHVRVSTEALEHVCDRLGPRIVARADAPRARLHLAVVVPLVDCQTALRFGHRGVVEHNGPEDLVSAVRPVKSHPFLQLVDPGPRRAIGERGAPERGRVFGVAPWRAVLGHESDELALLGRVHIVLQKNENH